MLDWFRLILRSVLVMISTGLVLGYNPGLVSWFAMPWRVGWCGTLLALIVCGVALDVLRGYRMRDAQTDVEASLREFVRDVESAYDEESRADGELDEAWYDIGCTYYLAKVRLAILDEARGRL